MLTCIDVQVLNGALLQQTFVVEFTVHNQMCDDCHRVEAKDYWRSCVQLRQKVCTEARYFTFFFHSEQKLMLVGSFQFVDLMADYGYKS